MHGERHRQALPHRGGELGRNVEVEAQPEGETPGRGDRAEIVQEDDEAPQVNAHVGACPARICRAQRTSIHAPATTRTTHAAAKASACTAGPWSRADKAAAAHTSIRA